MEQLTPFVSGPRITPRGRDMLISHREAIECARMIGVVAEQNALEAERLGRLPDSNVDVIRGSGLMPLLRPRMFGGYEADWITLIDCVSEVARHCGSTGWVMSFFIQHQFYLAHFPEDAQRSVYEQHPDPLIVTSFAPTGKVRKVEGGYEISGRWVFGSGGDFCDWAIVGGKVEAEGHPQIGNFLLSPGQFRIDRVWNSVGLRGSGSNDIVVDEPVFVPESHCYFQADALAGKAPGTLLHEGRLYRTPLALNAGFGVMAPLHGIARGAYEAFVSFTRTRVALIGDGKAADMAETQAAIGESKAEIDIAYMLADKMSATVFAENRPSQSDIVRVRRDFIMIEKILARAIDRLFRLSGARGLAASQPLQRHWRDFHAISHHFTFAMPSLQTAGRHELGLGPAAGDILAA